MLITALYRAAGDVFAPPMWRLVSLGLAVATLTFAVLWAAVATVLAQVRLFAWQPLDWLFDLFGALAVLVLSWLLFPAVVTLVMGFFLDRVATAVEARDYPYLGPARGASWHQTIVATLRLMGLTLLLNVLVLPLYVLLPGVNFFVFLGLNGYLFGREYFEVVALRRLEPDATRQMHRQFAGQVFVAGVAIAGLFAVPLVNLAAPVIATALMVHLFEGLRQPGPSLAAF